MRPCLPIIRGMMRIPLPALTLVVALLAAAPVLAEDLEVPAGKTGHWPAWIPDEASKERPCPLLVVCHGHGGTAANLLSWMKSMAGAEGCAVLIPEGIEKVGNGFGWNEFPDRGAVIEAAVRTLLQQHPQLDPKRIVWLGHSAGAWVCCQDGASRPEICQGVILTAAPTAAVASPARRNAPKPKVCLFLGTLDPNFAGFEEHLAALKAAKVAYSANRVTDLEHDLPDPAYLRGAIRWILEGEEAAEENTLPRFPSDLADRTCRHLLIRFKGAEGAPEGGGLKRSAKEALKEVERLAALLRKESAPKRIERIAKSSEDAATQSAEGLLGEEAVAAFGSLLRWACWTLHPGEVRVLRTSSGYHAVWVDPESPPKR